MYTNMDVNDANKDCNELFCNTNFSNIKEITFFVLLVLPNLCLQTNEFN